MKGGSAAGGGVPSTGSGSNGGSGGGSGSQDNGGGENGGMDAASMQYQIQAMQVQMAQQMAIIQRQQAELQRAQSTGTPSTTSGSTSTQPVPQSLPSQPFQQSESAGGSSGSTSSSQQGQGVPSTGLQQQMYAFQHAQQMQQQGRAGNTGGDAMGSSSSGGGQHMNLLMGGAGNSTSLPSSTVQPGQGESASNSSTGNSANQQNISMMMPGSSGGSNGMMMGSTMMGQQSQQQIGRQNTMPNEVGGHSSSGNENASSVSSNMMNGFTGNSASGNNAVGNNMQLLQQLQMQQQLQAQFRQQQQQTMIGNQQQQQNHLATNSSATSLMDMHMSSGNNRQRSGNGSNFLQLNRSSTGAHMNASSSNNNQLQMSRHGSGLLGFPSSGMDLHKLGQNPFGGSGSTSNSSQQNQQFPFFLNNGIVNNSNVNSNFSQQHQQQTAFHQMMAMHQQQNLPSSNQGNTAQNQTGSGSGNNAMLSQMNASAQQQQQMMMMMMKGGSQNMQPHQQGSNQVNATGSKSVSSNNSSMPPLFNQPQGMGSGGGNANGNSTISSNNFSDSSAKGGVNKSQGSLHMSNMQRPTSSSSNSTPMHPSIVGIDASNGSSTGGSVPAGSEGGRKKKSDEQSSSSNSAQSFGTTGNAGHNSLQQQQLLALLGSQQNGTQPNSNKGKSQQSQFDQRQQLQQQFEQMQKRLAAASSIGQSDNFQQVKGNQGGSTGNNRSASSNISIEHGNPSQATGQQSSSANKCQISLSSSLEGNFVGGWQSNADVPDRRRVILHIVEIIEQMRPRASRMRDSQRLPLMAKKLEEHLYRSAATKADYVDKSTLKRRLQMIAQGLGLGRNSLSGSSLPSSNSSSQSPNPQGENSNPSDSGGGSTKDQQGKGSSLGRRRSGTSSSRSSDDSKTDKQAKLSINSLSKHNADSGIVPNKGSGNSYNKNLSLLNQKQTQASKGINDQQDLRSLPSQQLAQQQLQIQMQLQQLQQQLKQAQNMQGTGSDGSTNEVLLRTLLRQQEQLQNLVTFTSMQPSSTGSANSNNMNTMMQKTGSQKAQQQQHMSKMEQQQLSVDQLGKNTGSQKQQHNQQPGFTPRLPGMDMLAFSMNPNNSEGKNNASEGKVNGSSKNDSESAHSEPAKRQKVVKQQQQRLLLLRHASKCTAGSSCKTQFCGQMVKLWKHLKKCRDKNCQTAHCLSSRCVLNHYRICKGENRSSQCEVCAPVIQQIRWQTKGEPQIDFMEQLAKEQAAQDSGDPSLEDEKNLAVKGAGNIKKEINSSAASNTSNSDNVDPNVINQPPLDMNKSSLEKDNSSSPNASRISSSMPAQMQQYHNIQMQMLQQQQSKNYDQNKHGQSSQQQALLQQLQQQQQQQQQMLFQQLQRQSLSSMQGGNATKNQGGQQDSKLALQSGKETTKNNTEVSSLTDGVNDESGTEDPTKRAKPARRGSGGRKRKQDSGAAQAKVKVKKGGKLMSTSGKTLKGVKRIKKSEVSGNSEEASISSAAMSTLETAAEDNNIKKEISIQPAEMELSTSMIRSDVKLEAGVGENIEATPLEDMKISRLDFAVPTQNSSKKSEPIVDSTKSMSKISMPDNMKIKSAVVKTETMKSPTEGALTSSSEDTISAGRKEQLQNISSEKKDVGASIVNSMTNDSIEQHLESLQANPQMTTRKFSQKCLAVLNKLLNDPYGWVFKDPVDPDELGIPDYFDVVKQPMDLGQVKRKLENGEYHDLSSFENDTKLVFTNAILYNGEDSDVGDMAKDLLNLFDKEFKSLVKGH